MEAALADWLGGVAGAALPPQAAKSIARTAKIAFFMSLKHYTPGSWRSSVRSPLSRRSSRR